MNFSPAKFLLLLTTMIFFTSAYVPVLATSQQNQSTSIQKKLATLEASFDGKIGIFAINTANNQRIQYRSEERFPIQSTFKLIGVSAILKQSITDSHLLQQKMFYKKQDIVEWSPITEKHIADGMTVYELCAAAMSYSDDTAINLLIKKLGGLESVTAFAHSIGDNTFRLDNWEPELNSNPKDAHDTSTPVAMEKSLQKLALGNALGSSQRKQLVIWMKENTTGDTRIRAGVPKEWIVADKTGASNNYGVSNDIGIIWPTKCAPIIVAIYSVHNKKNTARRDDIIVSAMRILLDEFGKNDPCIKL